MASYPGNPRKSKVGEMAFGFREPTAEALSTTSVSHCMAQTGSLLAVHLEVTDGAGRRFEKNMKSGTGPKTSKGMGDLEHENLIKSPIVIR